MVHNLRSPDLFAIEEVREHRARTGPVHRRQPDVGAADRSDRAQGAPPTTTADQPLFSQDGGEPGGNIRPASYSVPTRIVIGRPPRWYGCDRERVVDTHTALSFLQPRAVDPTNSEFTNSRKPLAGEFRGAGSRSLAIGNHLNSKGGDDPLFGRFQATGAFERGAAAPTGGVITLVRRRAP